MSDSSAQSNWAPAPAGAAREKKNTTAIASRLAPTGSCLNWLALGRSLFFSFQQVSLETAAICSPPLQTQVYLCVSRPHADTDCFFCGPLLTHTGYLIGVK